MKYLSDRFVTELCQSRLCGKRASAVTLESPTNAVTSSVRKWEGLSSSCGCGLPPIIMLKILKWNILEYAAKHQSKKLINNYYYHLYLLLIFWFRVPGGCSGPNYSRWRTGQLLSCGYQTADWFTAGLSVWYNPGTSRWLFGQASPHQSRWAQTNRCIHWSAAHNQCKMHMNCWGIPGSCVYGCRYDTDLLTTFYGMQLGLFFFPLHWALLIVHTLFQSCPKEWLTTVITIKEHFSVWFMHLIIKILKQSCSD